MSSRRAVTPPIHIRNAALNHTKAIPANGIK
jgi:hypothetical protein